MKVEIWFDVVCPWCYIGKRNSEAALAVTWCRPS
ncbi:MAG TPA: DsbA family protein [Acidimicrobiales bacterium]|nr:DsbA family protein [Acidimicrobiales bacterium]